MRSASSEDTRLRWHCVSLGRHTSGKNLSGENLRASATTKNQLVKGIISARATPRVP